MEEEKYISICILKLPTYDNIDMSRIYNSDRAHMINSATNIKVKREKYWAYVVCDFLYMHIKGCHLDNTNFHKEDNGKWYCTDLYCSLCHTDEYVAVAISNMEVGIDIETKQRFDSMVNKKEIFISKVLNNNDHIEKEEDYIKIWTQKEAIFKMLNLNFYNPEQIDISKFHVKSIDNLKDFEDLVISIAATNADYKLNIIDYIEE